MRAWRCSRRAAGESVANEARWARIAGSIPWKDVCPGGGEGAGVGGGMMGMYMVGGACEAMLATVVGIWR